MVEPFPAWPLSEEQPCAMGGRGARQGAGRHADSESDEGAGTMAMPRDGEWPMPHGRCFSAPLMPHLRQAPAAEDDAGIADGSCRAARGVDVCGNPRHRLPRCSQSSVSVPASSSKAGHRAHASPPLDCALPILRATARQSPRSPLHIEVGIMEAGDA